MVSMIVIKTYIEIRFLALYINPTLFHQNHVIKRAKMYMLHKCTCELRKLSLTKEITDRKSILNPLKQSLP